MTSKNTNFSHVPWMLLATVAFSVMALLVKGLTQDLSGLEIVFYRSLSHLVILLPIVAIGRVPIFKELSKPVLLRSTLAFLGVAFYFSSLARLDAGIASLLQWTAPAFTFLYAALVLKERLSPKAVLLLMLAFVGLVGALGISVSGFQTACSVCLVLGLGGAACAGFSYGVLKSTAKKANPESLAVWMSVVSLIGALFGLRGHVTWIHGAELLLVVGIGAMVSLYQFAVAKAYQSAPAIRVAPFSVAPAITVMLLEAVLEAKFPSAGQLVGSLVTVASLAALTGTRA